LPEKPAIPAQSAAPRRPAQAETSTIPFSSENDPAARVVEQLEGLTSALQAESKSRQAARPEPAPSDNSVVASSGSDSVGSDSVGEECLESYLRNYVKQLTGKTQEAAPSTPEAAREKQEAPRPVASGQPNTRREPTPAPELRDQLAALRELANASAREAVAASSQVQLVVTTRQAFLQAKAAALASSALAVAYYFTHANAAIYGALFIFPVALFLSCRFAWLFRCCSTSPT